MASRFSFFGHMNLNVGRASALATVRQSSSHSMLGSSRRIIGGKLGKIRIQRTTFGVQSGDASLLEGGTR